MKAINMFIPNPKSNLIYETIRLCFSIIITYAIALIWFAAFNEHLQVAGTMITFVIVWFAFHGVVMLLNKKGV